MSKTNKKSIVFGLEILAILAFGVVLLPFNKAVADYATYNAYNNPVPVIEVQVNNPVPNVSSINPRSSNVGVGTKTITITGSGFVSNSVARINGSNRLTTFIDDSHLLVQITGNDTSAYRTNGGFFITVFNGTPGGGYSNAAFFTINNPVVPPATSANANSSTTNFSDTNNTANNTNNANNTYTNYTDTNQNQTGNATNTTDTGTSGNNSGSSLASSAILGSNSFLPSGLIQWILFAIIILLIVIIVRKIFGGREKYDEAPMKHA